MLRHRAEQLPDARRDPRRARRRRRARHARCRQPRIVRRTPRRVRARARCARPCDPRERDALRPHPAQVPDEEHDRLQPQRARRFRGSARHPRASDDRLRGHARLHQRNHVPDGARLRAQGERADPVRRSRDRLPRGVAHSSRRRSMPSSSPTVPRCARSRTKPGLPETIRALPPDGAALLVETRAPDASKLAAQVAAIMTILAPIRTAQPVRFSTDPAECAQLWNVRKGMFPSVGAMRATGTTVIIEDVAFPVPRLAEATLDLQRLLVAHGYRERDHLRSRARGQPALRVHAGLQRARRGRALSPVHGRAVPDGRREVRRLAQGRARYGPQYRAVRRARMGQGRLRADAHHQAPVRSDRPAQSRRAAQRRPRGAPEAPEAAAGVRSDRRQVHRVRLLRAEVPVTRPDAVATAANRRCARDRATRGERRGCRPASRGCSPTTASTRAPPAVCAPPRARSASRPGC